LVCVANQVLVVL